MKILAFSIGDGYSPGNEKLANNSIFRQWQENVLRNEIHITAPYTASNYNVDKLYKKIYNRMRELIGKD